VDGENNKTLHIMPERWNLMHNLDYEMGYLSMTTGFDSRLSQGFLPSPLHPDLLLDLSGLQFNRHLGVMQLQCKADLTPAYNAGVKNGMYINISTMSCLQTQTILPLLIKRETFGIRYILYNVLFQTQSGSTDCACAHFHHCYTL
jgi:hypothetical protein